MDQHTESCKTISHTYNSNLWVCSATDQVMACCLKPPVYYLNQYQLLIENTMWHSIESNIRCVHEVILDIKIWISSPHIPGTNELTTWRLFIHKRVVVLDILFPALGPIGYTIYNTFPYMCLFTAQYTTLHLDFSPRKIKQPRAQNNPTSMYLSYTKIAREAIFRVVLL